MGIIHCLKLVWIICVTTRPLADLGNIEIVIECVDSLKILMRFASDILVTHCVIIPYVALNLLISIEYFFVVRIFGLVKAAVKILIS